MEVVAKLIVKEDTVQVSGSFTKREFVVEYAENPQYPEFVKFELIQDKCDSLDAFNVGDSMTIAFNLKGRKWTNPQGVDVYFNSLQAWRLSKAEGVVTEHVAPVAEGEPNYITKNEDGDIETLPF
jgi:hypothetical protein